VGGQPVDTGSPCSYPLKLLHVAATYLPAVRYGGTIASVHGLCRSLAARGHDVHVYTTSVDGAADSPVAHDTPVDIDGVKVWYFQSPRFRRVYWAPAMRQHLRLHVGGFDLVHTHAMYLWPLWAAARSAHAAGVPYVVSPRGMLEKGLIEQKSALLKAGLIAFVERRTFEHAAAIHVTSAREAEEAAAFGFQLATVREIPNGADLEVETGTVPDAISQIVSGPPYVLFLGRINWKKGIDRLLAAFARLETGRLVVAGHDDDLYRPALEFRAQRLGLADRVTFMGPVHGAGKAALLAGAQLLVLPSYSENFGNVVLEAMAAGRPVVVTPEVGLAPVVTSTGAGLVAEGGPDRLSRAIATLLNDPALRLEMGRRGEQAVVGRFAWPAVAAQMESLYESVIAHRSARA
jgi:glycosyltransferase involved in cell wall biosynthesis